MLTLAVKSCAACINLGGLWQIGMGCGACSIPDAGRCFRSCEELSRIQKRMEQCGKHQSCRACKDAGCDWFEGSYKDGCTVQYGQFMFFVPACPPTIAAAPVTTTTMDPVCKRCGDHEPTGALSYHLSCCNFGGSWFGNCGSPGDRRYQFSWDDGIQACKGMVHACEYTTDGFDACLSVSFASTSHASQHAQRKTVTSASKWEGGCK